MMQFGAAALFQIWRSGETLSVALAQFDPQLDKAAFIQKAKEGRSLSALGKRNYRAAGIDADEILDAVTRARLHLEAATDAQVSRERQLIAALENGELIAIGYATSKGGAEYPEIVPQFLIQRQFAKFRKSEFDDGAQRYSKVRIVHASAMVKSKIGRPSIQRQVFEIAAIIETQIRYLKPGEQAREVHRYGLANFPEIFTKNFPTNRAIDRHLKSYWKLN